VIKSLSSDARKRHFPAFGEILNDFTLGENSGFVLDGPIDKTAMLFKHI
jgi:hypothetical protein